MYYLYDIHNFFKNPSETTAASACSTFLQSQFAVPLRLVSVSYHRCIIGPWPFFQPLSQTLSVYLLPQLTPPSVHPWIKLEQAPWFYSFHALHSTGHKSLLQSSAISRGVHISLCSACAAPFATPALSVSACQSLICTSSICSLSPYLTLVFTAFFYLYTVSSSLLQNQSPQLFTLSAQIPRCGLLL